MPRQLPLPAPLALLLPVNNPHPLPNLALQRPHPRTLLLLLNIIPNHKSLPLHPPLHLRVLHPPNRLARSSTTTALRLARICRMPAARRKQLNGLVHADIGSESRHLALVHARVHGSVVVLVIRQFCPETAHDAVAGAREVGSWAVLAWRRGVQAAEDEFGAVHAGEVVQEVGAPWGGLGGGGVGSGGHRAGGRVYGAREEREAEIGSYGCC